MKISSESAQSIVMEIGNIVGQNINMMDEKGYIIASTDPDRVGSFHEGARRILDRHLDELYIKPEDATETMRAGLNLAVKLYGDIVGVIGITGVYEEIFGYGQIVKKMTEILIREKSEEDAKRMDQLILNRFLEGWVLDHGIVKGPALVQRGLELGIDVTVRRRVMVVSPMDMERYVNSSEGQQVADRLEQTIAAFLSGRPGAVLMHHSGRQVLLVPDCSDERMLEFAGCLRTAAKQHFSLKLAIGIDGLSDDTHMAYTQADKAWRSARLRGCEVCAYGQVALELFSEEVSRQTKEEYIRKVFPRCAYEEVRSWMDVLEAYFAADGSLQSAASALYIHKNTLQYKLKKLAKISGYDVRRPSDAPVLYIAMMFFKEVQVNLTLW